MEVITLSLEDNVVDWTYIEAARCGVSVSHLLGQMLAEEMKRDDEAYEREMREALKFNLNSRAHSEPTAR